MNTRRSLRNLRTENKQNEETETKNIPKSNIDSSDESSEEDIPLKKVNKSTTKEKEKTKIDDDNKESSSDNEKNTMHANSRSRKRPVLKLSSDDDGSSSDSSVGDYLKPADEIDLNSSFFQFEENEKPPDFAAIESKMFSGVQRLSDSEESDSDEIVENVPEIQIENDSENIPTNFTQMQNFNEKLKEAKTCVEKYQHKSKKVPRTEKSKPEDINKLLSVGEAKNRDSISSQNDLSSEEEMDWEEIEEKQDEIKIPKEGVQITVELPTAIRKKSSKEVDFQAAIKRRINRIRKENQVYVHKVHLLCWIAHGNFLNSSILNNEVLLGKALSLLPSEQCYPPKHADMSYLEQIVRWYGKMMKLKESSPDNSTPIKEQLNQQISQKSAISKRNFVLLFIIILRSLGLQCRLVLSFQCLPLRPPNSELFSVSVKDNKIFSSKNESDKASTSKDKSSKTKAASVNSSIKNKMNKSLNDGIKNKMNQSLNNSKTGDLKKGKNVKSNESNKKSEKSMKKSEKEIELVDMKIDKNKKISEYVEPRTAKTRKLTLKEKLDKNSDDTPETERKKGANTRKSSTRSNSKNSNSKQESSRISEKLANEAEFKSDDIKLKSTTTINLGDKVDRNSDDNVEKIKETKKMNDSNRNSSKTSHLNETSTPKKSSIKADTSTPKKLSLRQKSNKNSDNSPAKITKDISNIKKRNLSSSSSKNSNAEEGSSNTTKLINRPKSSRLSLKEKLDRNLDAVRNQNSKESSPKSSSFKIPQLDGADDSDSSSSSPSKPTKKLTLSEKLDKNLKTDSDFYKKERNSRRVKNKPVKYVESALDDDFLPSPARSPRKDLNHNKKSSETKREVKSVEKASTSKSESSLDVRGDIINLIKGQMNQNRHKDRSQKVRKSYKDDSDYNDSEYDSDFYVEPVVKKRRTSHKPCSKDSSMSKIEVNTKVKRRIPPKSELDRRALSTDDESSQDDKKKGNDVWIEVFLEEEEKWISVDLIKGQVHCVSELYNRASHPVSYIVAWNNNLSLKDITARYCSNWNTVTRKLRVDPKWWNETLKPILGVKNVRDKEEDEDLARQQLDQPLPTTISEYKNHPLYALKRHLLKFEAIYPPDAVTLGFVRNEPVYARECVHTLHSREIWVKHAKVVKPGMQPYKIVKARPKYDRLTGNTITDLPLEIFGSWQVEDYVPPTAENGIVPRNAFGNVELFKMCMLPKKTVHLQLPGLNKVARKLRIDCAPAVVGFDYHCGGSHPTFDGYVVCEEFKDALIAAWEEDQEETAKRELEKYEKRVWGNWRKLIKGLLIKERLKARYDFGEHSQEKKKVKPSKSKRVKTGKE